MCTVNASKLCFFPTEKTEPATVATTQIEEEYFNVFRNLDQSTSYFVNTPTYESNERDAYKPFEGSTLCSNPFNAK